MNQNIKALTDALFRDIEMTEEAQALKEELTADLNEHLSDLMAQGMSEEEALAQVRAGLSDFGELTRPFPKRQTQLMPVSPDTLPAENVRKIAVDLEADDLYMVPSDDGQIHLELSGDPDAYWTSALNGGVLSLEITRPVETPESLNTEAPLGKWLLQQLSRLTGISHVQPCRGTVRIPRGWLGQAELRSRSGDIHVETPFTDITASTASGDLSVRLFEGCAKARLASTSGDIRADGSAESVSLTSTSGDVSFSGHSAQLNVVTTSGDAELVGLTADRVKHQATSGDLSLDGAAREIDYRTVSGDVTMTLHGPLSRVTGSCVSGDARIRLADGQPAAAQTQTVSGSVRLSCQDGPAAAQLSLRSVSGDIQVV